MFDFTALDPNFKLAYAEAKWDSEYFVAGLAQLEGVVRMCILSLAPCLKPLATQFDTYYVAEEETEASDKNDDPGE
jgi:hypothetical protein